MWAQLRNACQRRILMVIKMNSPLWKAYQHLGGKNWQILACFRELFFAEIPERIPILGGSPREKGEEKTRIYYLLHASPRNGRKRHPLGAGIHAAELG